MKRRNLGILSMALAVATVYSATARAQAEVEAAEKAPRTIRFEARQLRALVDPRDGSVFQSLTAEGAIETARALTESGHPHHVVDILFSSLSDLGRDRSQVRKQPQGEVGGAKCLTLIVNGKKLRFDLEGGGTNYAIDPSSGKHVVQFSPTAAKTIYETLDSAGVSTESIMKTLFDLHVSTPGTASSEFGGEEDLIDPGGDIVLDPGEVEGPDPVFPGYSDVVAPADIVNPGCGTCETGSTCPTSNPRRWCYFWCSLRGGSLLDCWLGCGGEIDCCYPGVVIACLKCKVCPGPPDVDPTLP